MKQIGNIHFGQVCCCNVLKLTFNFDHVGADDSKSVGSVTRSRMMSDHVRLWYDLII